MTATNSVPNQDVDQELAPLRVPGGWLAEDMGAGWSRHESGSLGFAFVLIAVVVVLFVLMSGVSL